MISNPSRTPTTLWKTTQFSEQPSETAPHKNTIFKKEGNKIYLGNPKIKVQNYKTQSYFTLEMIQKLFEILKTVFINLSFLVQE